MTLAALTDLGGLAHASPAPKRVLYLDHEQRASAAYREFRESFEARVRPTHPNAVLERRPVPLRDTLPAMPVAALLGGMPPDVVVTSYGLIAQAMVKEAPGVPLVVYTLADPVVLGIADDPIRPANPVTGYTSYVPFELKHLELLGQCAPGLRTVGILADQFWATEPLSQRILRESAALFGFKAELYELEKFRDVAALFRAAEGRVDAWFVPDNGRNRIHAAEIAAAIRDSRKPSIGGHRSHVRAGGLMAYEPHGFEPWPRVADSVSLILSGVPAADIPFDRPKHFRLTVNLRAAEAIGLAPPKHILMRADDVIR